MTNSDRVGALAGFAALMVLVACGGEPAADKGAEPAPATAEKAPAPAEVEPPKPVQDPLVGGPYPTVLLSQAWFYKDANNKSKPGPARLEIWRDTPDGWRSSRLEDADSNVFHKAVFYDGGIVTIGGEKALLKKWTFADGAWKGETLLERNWGGKFNRLRDLEIGDVDGDGKDELVMATHDQGVVVVFSPDDPSNVVELDRTPDTFVHEIEICDIDGDGKKEFFATPTGRNSTEKSQAGALVMYRFDGNTYQRTVVEQMGGTHAKETLCSDLDGDGKGELFAVLEAELGPDKKPLAPVAIRQYLLQKDGSFTSKDIGSITDRQNRFLVPGDLDGDGQTELVASAMKSGVWLLDPAKDGSWTMSSIDRNSSGFEHASFVTDLDGDGKVELYVVADEQAELKRYVYNPETKSFDTTLIGKLSDNTFTWNMAAGQL